MGEYRSRYLETDGYSYPNSVCNDDELSIQALKNPFHSNISDPRHKWIKNYGQATASRMNFIRAGSKLAESTFIYIKRARARERESCSCVYAHCSWWRVTRARRRWESISPTCTAAPGIRVTPSPPSRPTLFDVRHRPTHTDTRIYRVLWKNSTKSLAPKITYVRMCRFASTFCGSTIIEFVNSPC